jgi:hypothetical protein
MLCCMHFLVLPSFVADHTIANLRFIWHLWLLITKVCTVQQAAVGLARQGRRLT